MLDFRRSIGRASRHSFTQSKPCILDMPDVPSGQGLALTTDTQRYLAAMFGVFDSHTMFCVPIAVDYKTTYLTHFLVTVP